MPAKNPDVGMDPLDMDLGGSGRAGIISVSNRNYRLMDRKTSMDKASATNGWKRDP
jgi:hypothetical protein